jgi:NADH dehydrogenase [ubiquinone] 1 alpha subcomplex assembly factor 1
MGSALAMTTRLFDFRSKETPWVVINDGVMGGVSSGKLVVKSGIATFRGTLRLDNNGGFASIRSVAEVGTVPSGTDAFELRVKGDGKAYQFTVDTEVGWYWFKMIPAKGKWSTVRIPFASLEPVSRFGEPTTRDQFTGDLQVSQIGVLIANKRNEEFSISMDWIEATDSAELKRGPSYLILQRGPYSVDRSGPPVHLASLSILRILAHWRSARNEIESDASGDIVVVVLGVPGNGPAGRAVQQWRVDLATKAWKRCHCKKVIFTGGTTRSKNSEASQMASIARLSGMDPNVIVL